MIKTISALTVVALLGATVLAAQQKPAQRVSTKTTAPTVLVATGKITAFDAATNTLTVATSHGDERFMLASPWPRIQEGKKTLAVAKLADLSGHQAQVHYTESGGTRAVASIHVENGPKTAKGSKS